MYLPAGCRSNTTMTLMMMMMMPCQQQKYYHWTVDSVCLICFAYGCLATWFNNPDSNYTCLRQLIGINKLLFCDHCHAHDANAFISHSFTNLWIQLARSLLAVEVFMLSDLYGTYIYASVSTAYIHTCWGSHQDWCCLSIIDLWSNNIPIASFPFPFHRSWASPLRLCLP